MSKRRPRLLDLFCGAGGTGMGYHRAGFDVVGVDIKPQKHYPFEFIQADALEYLAVHGHEFDAIHASPPCQAHSIMRKGRWQDREHPDLISAVRELLTLSGKPYVIENVEGARGALLEPIMLCGTMFGLQTADGAQVRRHRLFEVFDRGPLLILSPACNHNNGSAIGVYGGGQHPARRRPATVGVYGGTGESSHRDGIVMFDVNARREAMGIDWMTGAELSQAIPPAYTEWIGRALVLHLQGMEITR